jgi:hypothetical protein
MASGTRSATNVSGERNVVAQIAQLSWDKIKSAEKMAGTEKKNARNKLKVGEEGGITEAEFSQRFGRGSFFKKSLGSEFGGDKIARNRGKIESFFDKDVPAGRDPSKSKFGRYRAGFDYSIPGVEAKDPMVGRTKKPTENTEARERKSSGSSRGAINEAMASALSGIEIQLTKLSEKFTNTVSVPEGLNEIINKQSQVIGAGFDGLSKALYSLLGSIQKQTATMVRLDQEQKNLNLKNIDKQQALDTENALEGMGDASGNASATGFGQTGGKGKGGGFLGRMFGATALAKSIGKRGIGRAGRRAAIATGGRGAAKFMTKGTAKAFGKAGLKSGLKKIPLLGLGVGALFAAQRAMKGDYIGAGLELASGAASLVPGAGTAASLGVDGVLAARDAGAVPFAKGGMVTKPTLGVVGEGKDPELITPWNKKSFDMMNKARLDTIQKNKNKFADVQAEGLKEYYENRGGWQTFGDTLISLLKGAGGIFGDDNPPTPPPAGDPPGAPSIAKDEEELLLRLINAEAGGQGEVGQALVARSVMNRAGLIQSGKMGAGQFNATSGSVKDVITAPNQYSPYAQGKLETPLTTEQRTKAKAALDLAKNPTKLKEKISATGVSADQTNKLIAATGFRNYSAGAGIDNSQKVNEIKFKDHTFNTAGNSGLLVPGAEIKKEEPTPSTTPTAQTDWAAKITQNFGYKEGEKLFFTGPDNVSYHAVKTTTGWQIYRGGMGGVGGQYIQTTGTANKSLEPYLLKAGQEKAIQSKGTEQASALSQKSQEVAMARTGGPKVAVTVLNTSSSNSAIPKGDSAAIGVERGDLTPAFATAGGLA